MGSPSRRIMWVRILIPLMVVIGVVAAIAGARASSAGMACLIVAQVLVYRRASEELARGR